MLRVIVFSVMMFVAGLVQSGQVNINQADAPTLAQELNGVGDKKAQAIIDYRNLNGPFASVDDLEKVKGISSKTVEKNRLNISI